MVEKLRKINFSIHKRVRKYEALPQYATLNKLGVEMGTGRHFIKVFVYKWLVAYDGSKDEEHNIIPASINYRNILKFFSSRYELDWDPIAFIAGSCDTIFWFWTANNVELKQE